MEIELVTDPAKIPYRSLANLKVCTIGKPFLGLSTVKFRSLVREGGAIVETRPKSSNDVIIVGNSLSLKGKITVLRYSGTQEKPFVAAHRAFVIRFYHALRHIEMGGGVTFEQYLANIGAAGLVCST